MNEIKPSNTSVVELSKIRQLQACMEQAASEGKFQPHEYKLKHYFAPGQYARAIFIPAGHLLIGKMHKQSHLNFILKGRIIIATGTEKRLIEAPYIVISEPGVKRVGLALEDTIWVTVHTTQIQGEDKLDEIEDELIVKPEDEMEFIKKVGSENLCLLQ